jgi:hypothetical protein
MATIITNNPDSLFHKKPEDHLRLSEDHLRLSDVPKVSQQHDSRDPRKPKGKSKPQKVKLVALLKPSEKENGRKARPPARSSNVLYLQF